MSIDLEKLTRDLTDRGQLIEAGWIGFRHAVFARDMAPSQVEEMRNVFYAGAQHLFSSLVTILDPGDVEPTAADLQRMDLIAAELKAFIEIFEARHLPTEGSA